MLTRAGRLLSRLAAQTVPAAGVFGLEWSPAAGLILYWIESVLALAATAWLLALFARGADEARRGEIARAGIRTRDVLLVHGGAFGIFGLFFGLFLVILVGNGHLGSVGLDAVLAGLPWVAGFVGLELAIDLVRRREATAERLARRVDAGNRRFALFWIVGFFGVLGAVLFGKPLLLFGLFAAIKLGFEIGAALERRGATSG